MEIFVTGKPKERSILVRNTVVAAGWHVATLPDSGWSVAAFGPTARGAALCIASALVFLGVAIWGRRLPRSALLAAIALAMLLVTWVITQGG